MKIYIDLLFVINAVFDFFICAVTARAMHLRIRAGRLIAASFIGGISGMVKLFFVNTSMNIVLGIFVPVLMLMVAFGRMRPVVFAGSYLLMIASSFVVGGVVFAASELLDYGMSKKVLFAICFLALFICFFCFCDFSGTRQSETVHLSLLCDGNKYNFRLLCDSGCLVREPISGLPVVLVSARIFDGIYGKNITGAEKAIKYKSRLVPVKTAAGSDIIPAVMPEKLEYTYKGTAYRCHAMVARSNTDCFAGYDGIFPKTLL